MKVERRDRFDYFIDGENGEYKCLTLEKKPKTFGWDEAYRMMKEGKKVARSGWNDKRIFLRIVGENFSVFLALKPIDLDSTDWYVYE